MQTNDIEMSVINLAKEINYASMHDSVEQQNQLQNIFVWQCSRQIVKADFHSVEFSEQTGKQFCMRENSALN